MTVTYFSSPGVWRAVLLTTAALLAHCMTVAESAAQSPLRIGVFDVDASPPVGSPLAYDPTKEVQIPLSCRGIVLIGSEAPVVVCAVDWIGIANEGQTEFREALAQAAGTTPQRVAVHALHQHDAPRCDFTAARLLERYDLARHAYDVEFARDVIRRAAEAVRTATANAVPVTDVGTGMAAVEMVASNRRILGPDGRVKYTRWTATKDPDIRAAPVGMIDPQLRMISFWQNEQALATLTFYATHPQSYYRTGLANPDFPGIARNARQQVTGVPHIHFTGAGGNIGAGKWNDGDPGNRQMLANRVAEAMTKAWEETRKFPVNDQSLRWRSEAVVLPMSQHLDRQQLEDRLADDQASIPARVAAAGQLAWMLQREQQEAIDIGYLCVGRACVLFMPGELFVEYQIAAQKLRRDRFLAMAAYGEYGPFYIGTEVAYQQGGYETGPAVSLVAPQVEAVLMQAIRNLVMHDE